jgi:integrase
MSIYKRKFGTETRWCVYITFPNGRRFRKVVGTKKQAEEVHRKLKNEMVEGRWELWENEDILFSDLAGEYLEYARANKAKNTFRVDRCRIKTHLLPYFGNTSLSCITPQMVEVYKQMRLRDGVTPNTVNHELTILSHMMRMSIKWGYIDKNVVSHVDKMKLPEKPKRFLSQSEIQRLTEAAEGSHIHPLIVTALHTGMRKSELFNLKWSDVDFSRDMITVQAKDDWHTKNYRSRVLQLTPRLYQALRDHRKQHLELGVKSEYIFTYQGHRLKSNIKRSFAGVLEKAQLTNVTLHTLRHTFASQLVMAGVSLREVQVLMGHQSYETTLQYAHMSEDHANRQVLKLPFANGSGNSTARIRHAEVLSVGTPRKEESRDSALSRDL